MSQVVNAGEGLSTQEKKLLLERLLREKAAKPKIYPVSSSQRRLLLLDRLEDTGAAYNLKYDLHLEGHTDVSILSAALNKIIERHDGLRTTFITVEEDFRQLVKPTRPMALPVVDFSGLPPSQCTALTADLAYTETHIPFDLSRGPLFRLRLLRKSKQYHVLVMTIHHVIFDGLSMTLFIQEALELYRALSTGRKADLPELSVQYSDYAVWQNRWLQSEAAQKQLAYWRRELADIPAMLDLPTDRQRPRLQTFEGDKYVFMVPPTLTLRLREVARQAGATLYNVVMTGFMALMARYSGQETVVIGTAFANRDSKEVRHLLGFFVNTLVLRCDFPVGVDFSRLLSQMRRRTRDAYANHALPFETLVRELQPERRQDITPIFQVMMNWLVVRTQAFQLPGLFVQHHDVDRGNAKFDIYLGIGESEGEIEAGLQVEWEYNTALFKPETVARMAEHFINLLDAAASHPELPFTRLELLGGRERDFLLKEINQTRSDFSEDALVFELFERRRERGPNRPALLGEAGLSYSELNMLVDELALELVERGVQAGDLVGVMGPRRPGMVAAMLAVMKVGGAYVPLDPTHPMDRLARIVSDAGLKFLITDAPLGAGFPTKDLLQITWWDRAKADKSHCQLRFPVFPSTPAYIIYTSGSTGLPKGVVVHHRALVNFLEAMGKTLGFGPESVLPAVTTISFDISGLELFLPLTHGGALALIDTETAKSGDALMGALSDVNATHMQATPATWRMLSAAGWQGSPKLTILCGGEALPVELAASLKDKCMTLWNLYGPTEATIWAGGLNLTSWPPPAGSGSVSIGKPIANMSLYVLNDTLSAVPVGVPGELFIGGVGLAQGYHRLPVMTAERFIPNPYVEASGDSSSRLYRTGDLARYLADGNIVFLGRSDHQVKLRGFRIELGDIEHALAGHPDLDQAVVTLTQSGGIDDQRLAAYYTLAQGTEGGGPNSVGLRAYLGERLPAYMIPSTFVVLPRFPLSPSGKVDRRALPEPPRPTAAGYVAPRSPHERLLAGIFADVLGLPRVGVHDNFFELGGHSLLATRILARIQDALSEKLPVGLLFEAPTVAGLSARLGGRSATTGRQAIAPVKRTANMPLSFGQERLWFLDRLEGPNPTYNMPSASRLIGPLSVSALGRAIQNMVSAHESLRTIFSESEGRAVQRILPPESVQLPVIDLGGLAIARQRALVDDLVGFAAAEPFHLERGPLLRNYLLRGENHVLISNMHHIISDAWSSSIFIRDVTIRYNYLMTSALHDAWDEIELAEVFPASPIQYADYAAWQRHLPAGGAFQGQLAFWESQLADAPDFLDLPTDQPRPPVFSYRGGTVTGSLDAGLYNALMTLGGKSHATLFMTLLSAFAVLLARYANTRDLLIGTPIANRDRTSLENMIGFLVNTLVLRVDLLDRPSFTALLQRVRRMALDAYANQDVPFEMLVERLQPTRDMSHSPLFQVMFVLQNAPVLGVEPVGLEMEALPNPFATAKFDLTLYAREESSGVSLVFEYNADLFERQTIQLMCDRFLRLLQEAAAAPETPVFELPMINEVERRHLLVTYNETAWDLTPRCLHEVIAERAASTPQTTAVYFEDARLTFEALNRRADAWSRELRRLGVTSDSPVGVFMDRSIEMVVALLAVLKAGGAYLPLDPSYPVDRLAFILADAGPALILTGEALADKIPQGCGAQRLCTTALPDTLAGDSQSQPVPVHLDQLAYCIYTSGSTGHPKGVGNTHRAIHNRLAWMQRQYSLDETDRVLQKTPYSFDVSVWEFFWPLMVGAGLVSARPEGHKDAAYLVETIQRYNITTMHFVPSMLRIFFGQKGVVDCRSLRRVFASGEALPHDLQTSFFEILTAELHNLYGPTEAAVDVTYWRCDPRRLPGKVPIGRAICNTWLYVLGEGLQPCAMGIPGELYLGGVGLARGYLKRSDQTAERFLPHPFADGADFPAGSRLYRTGDLVRYLAVPGEPTPVLEFLGRLDDQVKIRGFRIELGEIEAALLNHEMVREAVVVAVAGPGGDKRLVAYVSLDGDHGAGFHALWRTFLAESLPEYMVPAALVVLADLPLTASGKINRRALPEPEADAFGRVDQTSPSGPEEELIAGLFRELLELSQVGARTSFFELGGHSLLATQLMTRINEAFNVSLALRIIFEFPSVSALAEQVVAARRSARGEAALGSGVNQIAAVPREAPLPLSFPQMRLWFVHQLGVSAERTLSTNTALRFEGAFDFQIIVKVITTAAQRHEAWRTRIVEAEGQPLQMVMPESQMEVVFLDLAGLGLRADSPFVEALLKREILHPFDLSAGVLVRPFVLRLAAREHILFINMHHLVSDGWSLGLMSREFVAMYEAFSKGKPSPLKSLPVQYPDFAVWQRRRIEGTVGDLHLAYWRGALGGEVDTVELPVDRTAPPEGSFGRTRLNIQLKRDLVGRLERFAAQQGGTLYMVLLAALQTLLHRIGGSRHVNVGTLIANRNHPQIQDLIGFFLNTLVLRTDLGGNPTVAELMVRVREVVLGAYAHQDLPYEVMLDNLFPGRTLADTTLFKVMLVLQNMPLDAVSLEGLKIEPHEVVNEAPFAPSSLTFVLRPDEEGLQGMLEYDHAIFEPDTVRALFNHWVRLLEAFTASIDTPIASLPMTEAGGGDALWRLFSEESEGYQGHDTVTNLFERSAQRTPDAPAIRFEGEEMSYRRLDGAVNRLAAILQVEGIGPECFVGVMLPRGPELIVALLAVLKAGGAYLPLDPSYPSERLAYMVADAGVDLLLAHSAGAGFSASMRVIDPGSAVQGLTDEGADVSAVPVEPSHPAYVIYTSGSTGKPKGVLVPHRALAHYTETAVRLFQLQSDDVVLQFASVSFDTAAEEIYPALAVGACLATRNEEMLDSMAVFLETCQRERVSVLDLPTAYWHAMVPQLEDDTVSLPERLRLIIIGGEQAAADRLAAWRRLAPDTVRVLNTYGPTETTVVVTTCDLIGPNAPESAALAPIGKPIAQTTALVLDRYLTPSDFGGELLIAGEGLARGYLNRPALTAERFVPNPFAALPGERLYRTGDKVRRLPDGNLFYLGRIDQQVKIRGFRVEIGEVETAIRGINGISEAVVLAQTVSGSSEPVLMAYVVHDQQGAGNQEDLRRRLGDLLPAFMIPSAFVTLEALPLMPNGKVDRKALPALGRAHHKSDVEFIPPETEIEEAVAEIWCAVLEKDRVGLKDDFFSLGGNSLLATQVVYKINKAFEMSLTIRQVFEETTLQGLSLLIEEILLDELEAEDGENGDDE